MKIEIWSDVMCPFCYIGKKNLEKALTNIPFKDDIQIIWKSYQLNPEYKNTNNENLYQYLSRSKNISIEQATQLTKQVHEMGINSGVNINFETNIPANTNLAHQIIHFAATKNLQNETKEAFFKAHFVDGKNIEDENIILEIVETIGLNTEDVKSILSKNIFDNAVKKDIYESQQMGVRGVPHFVFNEMYALSGAQPVDVFEKIITDIYSKTTQNTTQTDQENTCTDDNCIV